MRCRFNPCSPLLLAGIIVGAIFAPASAQERVALVVGNGAYAHALKLPNPPNDAADMTAALRDLGFEVISATDADKSAFDSALRDFARRMRGARTALFYYAGHGLQVAGKNYAVPIDARLEAAADLPVETVDIDQVLSVMQADENRVNLVFLDACRDNPLSRSFARALPATRSASVGIGLSTVNAGRGTLIAYATAPNQVALDGARKRNSPFTAALLRHIGTPGLDIALIMRRVTADVEAASGGAQSPWVHASLTTDVVLKGGTAPAYSPPPGPAIASVDPSARVAPRPEIAAPNEPLPADIPISPDVLKVVETHPLFANAPPILARSYNVTSVQTIRMRSPSATITSDSNTNVRWLRSGIVKYEESSQEVTTQSGTSYPTSRRGVSVLAANGFIKLSSANTANWQGGRGTTTMKLLRVEDMQGRIFPIALGNQFSYSAVYQQPSMKDEFHMKETCSIVRKYDGKSFHTELTGIAYLATCEYQSGYKKTKNTKSSGTSHKVYIESLGLWISADPISPAEQVASKSFSELTTITTSYTLKSFQFAR